MRMGIALAAALVVGILGLAGVSNEAYAVNSNNPGTMCRNFNAGEVTDIDYLLNGVRNLNPSFARNVICPAVRSPTSTNVVNVFVDGTANSGTTITCTLYSYDFNGTFLGSQSSGPMQGLFDKSLTVPGSFWGTSNVLCLLPTSGLGVIYDVDVVQ